VSGLTGTIRVNRTGYAKAPGPVCGKTVRGAKHLRFSFEILLCYNITIIIWIFSHAATIFVTVINPAGSPGFPVPAGTGSKAVNCPWAECAYLERRRVVLGLNS
jgi:hypothetical protein